MAACAPLSYKILAKTQTSALPACIAQLVKKCLNKLVNEYASSPPHDAFSGFSSGNYIFRKMLSCPPSYTLLDTFENSRGFDPFELAEGFTTVSAMARRHCFE